MVLGIVRLRGAQQIPAKRLARLEWDAEADLEAVRGFQRGDQAGLILGAFDRQARSCRNVMIKDSACSMGISNLTAAPVASTNSSATSPPSAARWQVVSFSLRIFTIAGPLVRFTDHSLYMM